MSTVVNPVGEDGHAKHALLMPIYQTSTFGFGTVEGLIADLADALAALG